MSKYSALSVLQKAYKEEKLMLFLGAGVSSALALPNWDELISIIAEKLDYDPSVFKALANNNPLILAEYYYIKKGKRFGRLRTILDQRWHSKESKEKLETSKFHEFLANKNFSLIYTTNYDQWIEKAFDLYEKPYTKISTIFDFADINVKEPLIIKFHGDFSDDESIILNEGSYFHRMRADGPLDTKFKADLLSNTLLIMGYSLSDVNIRRILFELNNIWSDESKAARPKCYLVVSSHNEIIDTVLEDWGIVPITADELGIIEEDRNAQNAKILEVISN